MKKALLSTLLLLLAFPANASANDEQYRCKDFVADFKAIPPDQKINPAQNSHFALSAGFIMGSYYAKTNREFLEQDTSGLGSFENKVVDDCSANPTERVPIVVLNAAKSLSPDAPKMSGKYTPMKLTDFRLDAKQLKGKRVSIAGSLQVLGDMAMIGEEMFTSNKVFVETKNLPRESRKYLIENCEAGCQVTVNGKAGTVMLNDGIVAEELITN